MRHVEIEFDPDLTPSPGVLAWATFGDADFPEPYRLTLRLMPLAEAEDGDAYAIEDSAGSDMTVRPTYTLALEAFLRAVALQVELGADDAADGRDEWLEVAEAIRGRTYGDDPNPARRMADRLAIREMLRLAQQPMEDVLQPHLGNWQAYARETGYDRGRNLSVVGREDV